jgi:NAD(P)-dependent dehydrogenase (short-subunit alcohol dehydrogenase family)
MSTSTPAQPGCVIVTGASTGIGAASARELAGRGFHVLAGVRRDSDADEIRGPGIEPVILDITDAGQIAALQARIDSDAHARPLRALVNNAGIGVLAPVESVPIDELRWMFEVNVLGTVAVTQAMLPALLRTKGRVVNISSVAGKVALPGWSPYASAKFALEAVTDSLRREVAPHGMHVIAVEPGFVNTERSGNGELHRLTDQLTPAQHERYGGLMAALASYGAAAAKTAATPEQAARVVADAVTDRRPRTRYPVDRSSALFTRLPSYLPDRVLDRVLASSLRSHYPATPGPSGS